MDSKENDKKIQKSQNSIEEERILSFWEEKNIFKKILEKESPKGNFVFYDGPPFATGMPHYGHILPGTVKDIVPRYKTMKGFHVPRVWGWDCHGLPIENLVEKKLKLNNKKDIEDYGVEEFNKIARESVLLYDREWKRIIPRTGRWIDMENAYKTMDYTFTESVFWSFKRLYDKGLVYKGFKSMHVCPRCESTLSNFEVNLGYKEIKDLAVTVAFRLKKEDSKKVFSEGGDKDIHILSWTTTPWTLPGNVALAVGAKIDYVLMEREGVLYILAENLVEKVMGENLKPKKIIKGKDLVGYSYEPLFDYFVNVDLHGDKSKGWKIYSADFVTTEEGTGVVHIAPAFGSDDYELSLKHNLPFIQHITMDGVFVDELGEISGMPVKTKDDNTSADVEIIKKLASEGKLFSKEKITHSYPHCWRCSTPLLNYATDSWFVNVTDIKDKLVDENKKIKWIPKHIGENRFGEWLSDAKDWSISRARFWGTPIPVWECDQCQELFVAGSLDDVAKTSNNSYVAVRHGEAESNVEDILSSDCEKSHHLTDKGASQVKKIAGELSKNPPDLIVTSDILRTRETANIIAKFCEIPIEDIVEDKRLQELDFGNLDGQKVDRYREFFEDWTEAFENPIPGGESYNDVKRRVGSLLDELEMKYSGKRILLVSHSATVWLLSCVAISADRKKSIEIRGDKSKDFVANAEVIDIECNFLPRNENYEIDLHRPYIDKVEFNCSCGGVMRRIPDVFDTWYDSGSMPFAKINYPFRNKTEFEEKDGPYFPADFIAEGLDQTRGWFYTLLVLSVALFGKSSFKKVVVNGTVLAEDGKKMSKSLQNYPDIMEVINQYSADALRYSLVSSPLVRAEDANFSKSRVDEVSKKLINRLMNVVSFYQMHAYLDKSKIKAKNKPKEIDRWIESRLSEMTKKVTENLEKYEISHASRPLMDFVEDLSTWYIRRSRSRIKKQDSDAVLALSITRGVLKKYSKILAPFMPFVAERVYEAVRSEKDPESVHLESWPEDGDCDTDLLKNIDSVRKIISAGLEKRAKAGIRVRQPLSRLILKKIPVFLLKSDEMKEDICSEVNVKEIVEDIDVGSEVEIDTRLTPELMKEGEIRDLVRILQSLRKKEGLTSEEKIVLIVETDEDGRGFLQEASSDLSDIVRVSEVVYKKCLKREAFKVGDREFVVELKKV